MLSDGSIGVEDRAGPRAEQGRLRRADKDASGDIAVERGAEVGAS
jgi:hypothetical protein